MVAAVCRACGRRNLSGLMRCMCGHSFEPAMEVPLTAGGQLLCPDCHRTYPVATTDCPCGHWFGEAPEYVHHMLRRRVTLGWASAVGGALLILCSPALALIRVRLALFACICGVALVAKSSPMIKRARFGLRVYTLPEKPPAARLLKR